MRLIGDGYDKDSIDKEGWMRTSHIEQVELTGQLIQKWVKRGWFRHETRWRPLPLIPAIVGAAALPPGTFKLPRRD